MIDRRIADRRRTVKEDGARRRLRRLLVLSFLVGLGGIGGWLLYQSSYLAVEEITIDGQVESQAAAILAEHRVVVGAPTINMRDEVIEAALLDDPWIAAASVRVTWPGSITVQILEHAPLGWVETEAGWLLATASGTVLDSAPEPGEGMPLISVGSTAVASGSELDAAAVAALEFVAGLPAELGNDAVVTGSEQELAAIVAGRLVILGYPADMVEKAAALAAVLESGVPEGAEISVVSPERPAVKPELLVETSTENLGESETSS